MPFRFKPARAVQAAAQLLRHAGGGDDRLRIVKLLYIADRRSIEEAAHPVVGGPVVAMRHGPVSSCMLDMVGNASEPDFLEVRGHRLCLVGDPGDGELSPFIVRIIRDIRAEYEDRCAWQVAEETRGFDEWRRNWNDGVIPPAVIPYRDIFEAAGRGDYEQAAADERERNALDDLLAGPRG